MINSYGTPEFGEVSKMVPPKDIPAVAGAHWTVAMSRVADRIEPYAAKRRKPIPRPVVDRHLPTVKRVGGKLVQTGRQKAAETARAISYDLSSLNDKDKLIREVASGQGKIGKSYIPGKGYMPAVKAGKKVLRAAAEERFPHPDAHLPLHERGLSASLNPENTGLGQLRRTQTVPSGRKKVAFSADFPAADRERVLGALPKKVRRPVTIHNAQPHFGPGVSGMTFGRTSSRSPSHVMVQPGSSPQVARHEFEHSQPRRKYHRVVDIQQSRSKMGREEARADARMIHARGTHEPVASDYEAHAILRNSAKRGNKKAKQAFEAIGANETQTRSYEDMRNKLKVPTRSLDHLPNSPAMDEIRAGERRGSIFRRNQVQKSYFPGKGYVPASKVPKDVLRQYAKGQRKMDQTIVRGLERRHFNEYAETHKAASLLADMVNIRNFKGETLNLGNKTVPRTNVSGYEMRRIAGGSTDAFAFTVGGRKGGKYIVTQHNADPHTVAHEAAHVRPDRTGYRMFQIHQDPAKAMREEARADMVSPLGHHGHWGAKARPASGYTEMAVDEKARIMAETMERISDPKRARMFSKDSVQAYRETQDKIHAARGGQYRKPPEPEFHGNQYVDRDGRGRRLINHIKTYPSESAYIAAAGIGLTAMGVDHAQVAYRRRKTRKALAAKQAQKVQKGAFMPNDGIRSTVSKMGPDQSELHVAGSSNQRRKPRLRKLPPDAVRRIR